MYELVFRNARIDDETETVDIGINGSVIEKLGSNLEGKRVIDVDGDVAVPSFIESHIHLDKALLERVRPNTEGTLTGAIRITGELKKGFRFEEVLQRSRQVLEMLIASGTTYLRAHPDTDPLGGLTGFRAMMELRRLYSDAVDMQIVAFPQEGIIKLPGAYEILEETMKLGADVVGGCPYNENSYEDTKKHIDLVFELARKYDKDLDFHADFGDNVEDMRYRAVDYIAEKTIEYGFQGRVTVGHMTSLSSLDPDTFAKTISNISRARINVVPLPATDLYLSGRGDRYRVRRGVVNPVPLIEAGINVAFSSNNIRNAFTPFGKGDLLHIGSIYEHVAQLGSLSNQKMLLDMITKNAAKILHLERYGLNEGCVADFTILATKRVSDIFLDIPVRRFVVKRGRVIYRSELVEMKNF
jgi:cytosine deaminase